MRGYFFLLLQCTMLGLVVLVLNNVGFEVIANAAMGIFSSWGGFFAFLAVMAGFSGVVFAFMRKVAA
ncbi:hypothetical protein [Actinomadura sp. NPDC049753]|uniref:hypothetical protein n=1 Tax=Actinomadura sp. NPDC049753 TaxID=3154739 RepID=UPI003433D692